MKLSQNEIQLLENYLRKTFGTKNISAHKRSKAEDSAEIMIGSEFVGLIHKDVDEGETSYTFTMSILDIDLAA